MKKFFLCLVFSSVFVYEANAKPVDYVIAIKGTSKVKTTLIKEVKGGNVNRVKLVLEKGVSVNAKDRQGNNAYCYAYANKRLDIASLLQKYGANTVNDCYVNKVLFTSKPLTNTKFVKKTKIKKVSKTSKKTSKKEIITLDDFNNEDILVLKGDEYAIEKPSIFKSPTNDKEYMSRRNTYKATTASSSAGGVSGLAIAGGVIAVGGVAMALGGGGGGSSTTSDTSGDTPPNPYPAGDPSDFETAEFYGLGGGSPYLDIIGAQYSYARGYTGEGVKVAVIDQGIDIDHPDLAGNLNADLSGTNLQGIEESTGDPNDPSYQEVDETHGTMVAGTIAGIKNDAFMHGVAYNSTIIPYRIGVTGSENLNSSLIDDAVANAVSKGAFIANLSLGMIADASSNASTNSNIDGYLPADYMEAVYTGWYVPGEGSISSYMADFIDNVTNGNAGDGMIIVKSAGNDSYSESGFPSALPLWYNDFDGHFINVVALDENGTNLASYSNQCGVTKNYCLAAPGTSILSTIPDDAYAYVSGTSFSAPTVAGAAAVIKSAFPYMDATEVVNLMFSTADDIGAAGIDDVYGNGLLNLNEATSSGSSPTALTYSGDVVSFSNSRVTSSSVISVPNIKDFVMTDEYNRTFSINGGDIVNFEDDNFDLEDKAKTFANSKTIISSNLDVGTSLEFTTANNEENNFMNGIESMKFTSSYGDDFDISFGFTETPGSDFVSDLDTSYLLENESVNHPFLALADSGLSTSSKYKISDDLNIENNLFLGDISDSDNGDIGSLIMSSAKLNYNEDQYSLGLELGFMTEENSMLGSNFEGAFALGGNNATYFAGLSGDVNITNNLRAFGSAYIGQTEVNTASNSLIDDVDTLSSTFANAGLEYSFDDTEKAGFVFSQPLKVYDGSMSYGMASSRNNDGSYNFQSFNHDLSANAAEIDFQAYYKYSLYENTDLNIGAIHRMNADSIEGESETAVMFKIKTDF